MASICHPFQCWKPHNYLHHTLATQLFFPASNNLSVLECSQRDLQFHPIAPLWMQQCWFTSPVMYQYTASMVRFHTQLLPTFCQVKGNCWNREHPGGPLERMSWGGISKARWVSWAPLLGIKRQLLRPEGPFFREAQCWTGLTQLLWCMQILIYIISKKPK